MVLITQFGISMLVPILLCCFAGVYIGKRFQMEWLVIPFFFVGALAGFRNIYVMAKKIYQQKSEKEQRRVKKN
nr:AtpZ/AtpI family protein [Roseburia sp. MSJ-14]